VQLGATSPAAHSSFWSLHFRDKQHPASEYETLQIQITMAVCKKKIRSASLDWINYGTNKVLKEED